MTVDDFVLSTVNCVKDNTHNKMIYAIFIIVAIASWLVQQSLKSKIEKYSQVPLNMTGKQVAEKMLHDNGIDDVQVISIQGQLTDHYNPKTKTVNLSETVYDKANIAAAAVAAHECGHVLQHATEYAPLSLRTALVPPVSFASKWVSWILLIGILLVETTPIFLEIGIALFALTTLFSFVTLPVEINASKRAVEWLNTAGITNAETTPMAQSALRSAAYTYVVAAVSSLATLMYYVIILMRKK